MRLLLPGNHQHSVDRSTSSTMTYITHDCDLSVVSNFVEMREYNDKVGVSGGDNLQNEIEILQQSGLSS